MMCFSGQAFAAKSTYIVAPFSVEGGDNQKSLQNIIPKRLTSRLFVKDAAVPARDLPANTAPVTTKEQAEKLRAKYKADYVIWGSVTVLNDDCSIDARVQKKGGQSWAIAKEAKTAQITAAINNLSDAIKSEAFGLTGGPSTSAVARSGSVASVKSGGYLGNRQIQSVNNNSQEDDNQRSQALKFPAIGMEVVDGDNDGKNEIFLLEKTKLHAYFMKPNGQLEHKNTFNFPKTWQCLSIRSLPRSDGKPWIIVNSVDNSKVPSASVFTYSGGKLTQTMKNIRWYLNVVRMAPSFQPTLIGQEAQPPRLFKPGSLSEMMKQGDTLVASRKINLSNDVNVFNFTYLPGGGSRDGDKLITLTNNEKLRVYNSQGNRLAETSESYSGSATGLEIDPSMPGLGKDDVTLASMFYIPMRMLAMDLENDGKWELLVNKPRSTASQIFDRYRFFPEGRLFSLFWDGSGLNAQWATRRVTGSIVDYTLADANNDGILDLVFCLNTHPGAIGAKQRKAQVHIMPLDTNMIDQQGGAIESFE